jgi:excisionase family DNA binding protein
MEPATPHVLDPLLWQRLTGIPFLSPAQFALTHAMHRQGVLGRLWRHRLTALCSRDEAGRRHWLIPNEPIDPDLWAQARALVWLTPAQVARRLGVQSQTVLEHCREGRLPALRGSGEEANTHWLIPEVEAQHFACRRGRGGKKGRSGRKPDPNSRRSRAKARQAAAST